MRRRALLAASQTGGGGTYDDIFGEIPPESTEFGWPLYITIPFKGPGVAYIEYLKESNEITQQLLQWVRDNNVEEGSPWMPEYCAYPPELYINGILVNTMISNDLAMWDISLDTTLIGEFRIDWVTLWEDGAIEILIKQL